MLRSLATNLPRRGSIRSNAMPATPIVVVERSGALAARLAPHLEGEPIVLRQPRSRAAFEATLRHQRYAVVLIDGRNGEWSLQHLLEESQRWHAFVLVVASDRISDWTALEWRELGVRAILPTRFPEEHWGPLIRRLIAESQARYRQTTAEPDRPRS